jgi:hypothetical protein
MRYRNFGFVDRVQRHSENRKFRFDERASQHATLVRYGRITILVAKRPHLMKPLSAFAGTDSTQPLNRPRTVFVLSKIDEILAWE